MLKKIRHILVEVVEVFAQEVLTKVLRLLHIHIILVSIIQTILMEIKVNLLLMIILMQTNILLVKEHLGLLEMLGMGYLLGEVRLIIQ
jgi:hypothetical protein